MDEVELALLRRYQQCGKIVGALQFVLGTGLSVAAIAVVFTEGFLWGLLLFVAGGVALTMLVIPLTLALGRLLCGKGGVRRARELSRHVNLDALVMRVETTTSAVVPNSDGARRAVPSVADSGVRTNARGVGRPAQKQRRRR